MKVERVFERLSESAVLFSENLCEYFQRQRQLSRLCFLVLKAAGEFITLFSAS